MFNLFSIAANSLRSSALISMLCGEVPMMFTPFFLQAEREVERQCLPAELRDGAPAFFAFVDVPAHLPA